MIDGTTPYQPVVCFVDYSAVNDMSVEALCNALANHLSYTFVFVNRKNAHGEQEISSHPSLSLKSIEFPLEANEVKAKLGEFLIQSSQLASHLVRMENLEKLDEREKILV